MPFDAYSPCPGGTGKKIKFCCSDLSGELEKIERMIEGEQYQACLSLVERLEQKTPGRACLMAAKGLMLRVVDRLEEAKTVAAEFLRLHPNNPIALAESAIVLAATEGGVAAMSPLQQSLAAVGGELPGRVYEMLGMVGQVLVLEGNFLAARAVLSLQATIEANDSRPIELLARMNLSPSIPPWVKDERWLADCPSDVPWRDEFRSAVAPVQKGQWSTAAEHLLALAEKAGDPPVIWRSLATLRGWAGDRAGSIEALRKYQTLGVPLDDAVEAEALALSLADDPLGDRLDVLDLEFAAGDVEQLQLAMASSPRIVHVPVDLAAMAGDGEPPPKAVFAICDRAPLETADGAALGAIPRHLCQAALYGRQTDREARLEVIGVVADDLEQVKAILTGAGGSALGPLASEEVAEHVSATHELLHRKWRLPHDVSPEKYHELAAQYEKEALLGQWPKSRLGLLDGKSPEEAAGEERYRVRLLATVSLLEFWADGAGIRFDFNQLRTRLGLPLPEAIDPEQLPVERLPLARLARVVVEKLSDEALLAAYRRASGMNARAALGKLAQAIVDRPSLAGRDESLRAYSTLARLADRSDQALEYVDRARQAAEAAGRSSAPWDVAELSYRFERLEADEAGRVLRHLEAHHFREPGVVAAVQDLLVRYGLLRPDGTPVGPAAAPPQADAGIVVPGASAAEPGELWTPDGTSPAGEKPKIWVPGMD